MKIPPVPSYLIAQLSKSILFLKLLANPNPFGSTGPGSGGFAFGAPSAPSTTGFNFAGSSQANTGASTFAFGAGVGGAPTF